MRESTHEKLSLFRASHPEPLGMGVDTRDVSRMFPPSATRVMRSEKSDPLRGFSPEKDMQF